MLNKVSTGNSTAVKLGARKESQIIVPAIPSEAPEVKKIPKGGAIKFERKLEPTTKDLST